MYFNKLDTKRKLEVINPIVGMQAPNNKVTSFALNKRVFYFSFFPAVNALFPFHPISSHTLFGFSTTPLIGASEGCLSNTSPPCA